MELSLDYMIFRVDDISVKKNWKIILRVRRELITKSTEICYSGNGVKPRLPGCLGSDNQLRG